MRQIGIKETIEEVSFTISLIGQNICNHYARLKRFKAKLSVKEGAAPPAASSKFWSNPIQALFGSRRSKKDIAYHQDKCSSSMAQAESKKPPACKIQAPDAIDTQFESTEKEHLSAKRHAKGKFARRQRNFLRATNANKRFH